MLTNHQLPKSLYLEVCTLIKLLPKYNKALKENLTLTCYEIEDANANAIQDTVAAARSFAEKLASAMISLICL